MRNRLLLPILAAILFAFALSNPAFAQDDPSLTRLYDTTKPFSDLPSFLKQLNASTSSTSSTSSASSISRWTLVAEDNTSHTFAGDAVFMNDKVAVVLRKQSAGVEVSYKTAAGFQIGAGLAHMNDKGMDPLAGFKIIENGSGAVVMETTYKSGVRLKLRMTTGEGTLEVQPGPGAVSLGIDSPTVYTIVPDFFGDDLAYDGHAYNGRALPAENMCINLFDGPDFLNPHREGAMMMCVWESSKQTAWLVAAEGNWRTMRIDCMPEKKIWLAFMQGQGIWSLGSQGGFFAPFPAKWRMDVMWVPMGVTQSSDAEKSGEFLRANSHGTFLIYPLDRVQNTPITTVLPTDVMRNTLGVGPCQYILAVEGMQADGDPTPNNVMEWVEKQFEAKKDKNAADDIKERIEVMCKHIAEANSRLKVYSEIGTGVALTTPDAKAFALEITGHAKAGMTPAASPDRANKLAADVVALIGKDNAAAECKKLGEQLREIGEIQDHALARCRMSLRRLKQHGRTISGEFKPAADLAALQSQAKKMLSSSSAQGSSK